MAERKVRPADALPQIAAQGTLGAPPPDAPMEVSQPITTEAKAEMLAKARVNERELKPLTYGAELKTGVKAESVVAGKEIQGLDPYYQRINAQKIAEASRMADPSGAPSAQPGSVDPISAEDLSAFPAASNTDSPSRGMPGSAVRPAGARDALVISGGFGVQDEGQYYPLNGDELKALVNGLLDTLHARMENDLRFSLALCYPRVSATLRLEVTGEVQDQAFQIQTVDLTPEEKKTPLEVAKRHGDSVVFCLVERRREFDEHDQVETPPDAMRDELQIPKPHKQLVQMGQGQVLVDRPLGF